MPPRKRTEKPEDQPAEAREESLVDDEPTASNPYPDGPPVAEVPAAQPGHDEPGNQSDLDGLVEHRPQRAAKLDAGNAVVVGDDLVTEHPDGEKIGRIPGEAPTDAPTAQFHYQVVVLPVGDQVSPGPDTAAITACLAAGYRPVAEAVIDGVTDHPDGVSKVVTWRVPCVYAPDQKPRT